MDVWPEYSAVAADSICTGFGVAAVISNAATVCSAVVTKMARDKI